jgi:uncharacterized membrane protein
MYNWPMKIENVKHIKVAPSVVWSVTEDVERWHQWTPTIESIRRLDDGPFSVGSAAMIKQPGLPETRWTVTEMMHGERFTWESRVRGMCMSATHQMVASEGGTQSVLRIEVRGGLATLMRPLLTPLLRRSLEQEHSGLKAWCEANTSSD